MHCDESDDPLSRHVETLTHEAHRLGLQGRVTGFAPHVHASWMDNYYVSKLPLMAEAGLTPWPTPDQHHVAGPPRQLPQASWHDAVPELLAASVNVAFGQDRCMDPWYSLGSGDI